MADHFQRPRRAAQTAAFWRAAPSAVAAAALLGIGFDDCHAQTGRRWFGSQPSVAKAAPAPQNGFAATIERLLVEARRQAAAGQIDAARQTAQRARKIAEASSSVLGNDPRVSTAAVDQLLRDLNALHEATQTVESLAAAPHPPTLPAMPVSGNPSSAGNQPVASMTPPAAPAPAPTIAGRRIAPQPTPRPPRQPVVAHRPPVEQPSMVAHQPMPQQPLDQATVETPPQPAGVAALVARPAAAHIAERQPTVVVSAPPLQPPVSVDDEQLPSDIWQPQPVQVLASARTVSDGFPMEPVSRSEILASSRSVLSPRLSSPTTIGGFTIVGGDSSPSAALEVAEPLEEPAESAAPPESAMVVILGEAVPLPPLSNHGDWPVIVQEVVERTLPAPETPTAADSNPAKVVVLRRPAPNLLADLVPTDPTPVPALPPAPTVTGPVILRRAAIDVFTAEPAPQTAAEVADAESMVDGEPQDAPDSFLDEPATTLETTELAAAKPQSDPLVWAVEAERAPTERTSAPIPSPEITAEPEPQRIEPVIDPEALPPTEWTSHEPITIPASHRTAKVLDTAWESVSIQETEAPPAAAEPTTIAAPLQQSSVENVELAPPVSTGESAVTPIGFTADMQREDAPAPLPPQSIEPAAEPDATPDAVDDWHGPSCWIREPVTEAVSVPQPAAPASAIDQLARSWNLPAQTVASGLAAAAFALLGVGLTLLRFAVRKST